MKSKHIILSLLFFFVLSACKKGPGLGGRASVKGKVYARNYTTGNNLSDSGYVGGQKVYLRFGDEVGVGDDVDTDNTGTYLFPYLRKGKYSVYVYSKTDNNKLDSAVVQTFEITERKAEVELPQFNIKTFKN